ncbi:MAG: alpha-hydroxy-acid oxidizing protein, partial [Rhodobacteraceae bacterium]|nr:alpha-hydroxy-acid oxidizing protein [Paracoccaceae bacterium]
MSLDGCFNIGDLRKKAKRRLPAPIFHYIDGGADDEVTLRRNTSAFDDYELVPDYLVDVSKIDTRTKLLGLDLDWPLFCSPTAMSKLFHHEAEPAVARAARKMGTMYSLSTLGTTSIEDIAAASDGPKMFQVYIFKDRGLTREFVARCKAAKFHALSLTVDVPIAGNRERDYVTGMILPPRLTWKSLLSFATHPDWGLNALRDPSFDIANVKISKSSGLQGTISLIGYINQQIERSITWKDAEWLAQEWGGPFIVKGVHSARDAKRAADIGAHAVMISNHGGRQLD